MFFDNYKAHHKSQVRNSLFWEYDIRDFDWEAMKVVVVQRIVERGRIGDFYAILNLYGGKGVCEAIKRIPYLNPKDMSFVCAVFDIKKENLLCYTRKPSAAIHWDS